MVFTMLQCLLYEGKISCRNKCASFLVVASRKLRDISIYYRNISDIITLHNGLQKDPVFPEQLA